MHAIAIVVWRVTHAAGLRRAERLRWEGHAGALELEPGEHGWWLTAIGTTGCEVIALVRNDLPTADTDCIAACLGAGTCQCDDLEEVY